MEVGIDRDDPDCETELPVLCVTLDRSNTLRPPNIVHGSCSTCAFADSIEFYHGWNGGHIATTLPVKRSKFQNRGEVDAFCATSFGLGLQVSCMGNGRWIPVMNGTRFANRACTVGLLCLRKYKK